MNALRESVVALVAGVAILGLLGCSADFDPPSEIKTLRVMAVQKDKPYAKPGEDIEMRMLWYDGSPLIGRPVQVSWIAACFDPKADLYQGCFEQFAELGAAAGGQTGTGGLPPGLFGGIGDRFTFTMPDDIISEHAPSLDTKLAPYGLAYVFFTVCAGELGPPPEGAEVGFPVYCYGPGGEPLGPDDFVAGYSAVYSFEDYQNQNPIMTGFEFRSEATQNPCIGDTCIGFPQPDADCALVPCVPTCAEDGGEDCPEYSIKPVIDRASAEIDQVSVDAYGDVFEEQMWVRYYVTRGSVKSDLRLLNDAKKGWNGDYGTKFRAPKQPGMVSIWAVAHDNRGGVEWVRQDVLVQ